MNYSREELISICEDAVVDFHDWHDRDSYASQHNVADIYSLLKSGCEFKTTESNNTISVDFINITDEQWNERYSHNLDISSLDDYREEFGYDNEMFDCNSMERSYTSGYLPTRKRLDDTKGGDWY